MASIVLASASPRRRELLSCLGVAFRVMTPAVPEGILPGEGPREMVTRLAVAKARAVAVDRGTVIGADSTVVLDGRVLGKPKGAAEARGMLKDLRGREHQVITGVAVEDTSAGRTFTGVQVSTVAMRDYSDQETDAYIASGEPLDKAGAYAIQDRRFRPARRWEGCYANIMGLPLCLLLDLLREARFHMGPAGRMRPIQECSPCPLRAPGPDNAKEKPPWTS